MRMCGACDHGHYDDGGCMSCGCKMGLEGFGVFVEKEGGGAVVVASAVGVQGEKPVSAVPPPQSDVKKIRRPDAVVPGKGVMGDDLPLGEGIADKVGRILMIKHGSKDPVLVERHARFKSTLERSAFSVARTAVVAVGDFAASADSALFEKARGRALELEKEGVEGWGFQNEFVRESGNLELYGMGKKFLDTYVNVSHADGGAGADSIEAVAKAFGSQETEAGKLDKIKGWFGKGGK